MSNERIKEYFVELSEIKYHIAHAELEEAIRKLLHLILYELKQKQYQETILSISGNFHYYNGESAAGTIDTVEYGKQRNKIAQGLLKVIKALDEELNYIINPPKNTITPKPIVSSVQIIEPKEPEVPRIILEAEKINKRYRRSSFELNLEKLTLKEGTITALVGENATGKTTLIKIISGLLAQNEGRLTYPLLQSTQTLNWHQVKQQIAYIPQFLNEWHIDLYRSLCLEAVTRGIAPQEAEEKVKDIIHRLGLVSYMEKQWRTLSGGYKLRFALAKALVWHPKLLILDEPLAHLDIKAQLRVLDDLKRLAKSSRYPLTILLSSQHIHEVEYIADEILFMQQGNIEHCGNTKTYNTERDYNYFEIESNYDILQLEELLNQLNTTKHIHILNIEGPSILIKIEKGISSLDFQQFLARHQVTLYTFRDISQSIKLKFYEKAFTS